MSRNPFIDTLICNDLECRMKKLIPSISTVFQRSVELQVGLGLTGSLGCSAIQVFILPVQLQLETMAIDRPGLACGRISGLSWPCYLSLLSWG